MVSEEHHGYLFFYCAYLTAFTYLLIQLFVEATRRGFDDDGD